MERLVDLKALGDLRNSEHTRLMLLGVAVGAAGGLAAGLFDKLTVLVASLGLGTPEPSLVAPAWQRMLIAPVIGGLLAGLAIAAISRRKVPGGIADVVLAVSSRGQGVSARDGVGTGLAAALSLGTGHSGGREGPIVLLASSLAASLCRRIGVAPNQSRLLVAAAASAGIAASFNTPVGGAFFALEILLGNFALEGFAPVVAATVTGTVVGQAILGDRLALVLPAFKVASPAELIVYPFLGVLCGLVAVAFKRLMIWAADQEHLVPGPRWAKPAVGGAALGVVGALGLNEVAGNGYGFLEAMIDGKGGGPALLLAVLGVKLLATGVSRACKNGTGLFAPSLFVGGVAGCIFGEGVHALWPEWTAPPGAYGMVAMAAVSAAVTRAPITMTLMLFEMTGNYQVILPVLLAVAVAGVVTLVSDPESIFVATLHQKGFRLDLRREQSVMYDLRVQDVMRSRYDAIAADAPFADLVRRFLENRIEEVYVIGPDGRYHGLIDIQDVKGHLGGAPEHLRVADVERRDVPSLDPDAPLADALPLFFRTELDELPVLDREGRLLGVLAERDVVGAFNAEVLRKDALLARVQSGSPEARHTDFFELPPGHVMEVVEVHAGLVGRSLKELGLPARFGVTVVAVDVKSEKGRVRCAAEADRVLGLGDALIVVGPDERVKALATA